jgi:hypothetical protein
MCECRLSFSLQVASLLEMDIDRLQRQELPIQLYSVLVGNINDQTVTVVFL